MLNRLLSLPDDVLPDVVEVVERTRAQIQFARPDIEYLFTVYNRYLNSREPQDINCGGCVTRVVGWLRAAVTEYNQDQKANGNG